MKGAKGAMERSYLRPKQRRQLLTLLKALVESDAIMPEVTTPSARVGKNEILKLGMRGGECVEGVYCERKDLFEPFFEGVSVLVFELCVVCCLEESVWLKKGWMWWLFVGCV